MVFLRVGPLVSWSAAWLCARGSWRRRERAWRSAHRTLRKGLCRLLGDGGELRSAHHHIHTVDVRTSSATRIFLLLSSAYPYLRRRVGHAFVHGYSPADFPRSPPPPLSRAGSTRPPSSVGTKKWVRRGGGAETYTVSRVRCLSPGAGSKNGRHAHRSIGGSNAGARGRWRVLPLHARSFTFTPRRRRLRLDAAGLGKVRNEDKMGRRYARESAGLFEAALSRVRCTVCYAGAPLLVSREDLGEARGLSDGAVVYGKKILRKFLRGQTSRKRGTAWHCRLPTPSSHPHSPPPVPFTESVPVHAEFRADSSPARTTSHKRQRGALLSSPCTSIFPLLSFPLTQTPAASVARKRSVSQSARTTAACPTGRAVFFAMINPDSPTHRTQTNRSKLRRIKDRSIILNFGGVENGLDSTDFLQCTTPAFWFRTAFFWRDYPHTHLSGAMKRYYVVQIGYWVQQWTVLLLGLKKRRSDYWEYMVHHVVTV
ncbi:hypothetical protein C8F04DRAFT_1394579 [Mycena alexandri]|uniref:TLC domain-containing protein n=1 Tax=Mycena alexandri TaxID=1745969 RepID=A0AAD6X5L0_9AGAR|nr:hypothetical protein C8F04DRAFT_1394579 [Mycena alexandri]